MQQFLDHLSELAAAGSEWEVRLAGRGVLGELAAEIAWVARHAADLVDPGRGRRHQTRGHGC